MTSGPTNFKKRLHFGCKEIFLIGRFFATNYKSYQCYKSTNLYGLFFRYELLVLNVILNLFQNLGRSQILFSVNLD